MPVEHIRYAKEDVFEVYPAAEGQTMELHADESEVIIGVNSGNKPLSVNVPSGGREAPLTLGYESLRGVFREAFSGVVSQTRELMSREAFDLTPLSDIASWHVVLLNANEADTDFDSEVRAEVVFIPQDPSIVRLREKNRKQICAVSTDPEMDEVVEALSRRVSIVFDKTVQDPTIEKKKEPKRKRVVPPSTPVQPPEEVADNEAVTSDIEKAQQIETLKRNFEEIFNEAFVLSIQGKENKDKVIGSGVEDETLRGQFRAKGDQYIRLLGQSEISRPRMYLPKTFTTGESLVAFEQTYVRLLYNHNAPADEISSVTSCLVQSGIGTSKSEVDVDDPDNFRNFYDAFVIMDLAVLVRSRLPEDTDLSEARIREFTESLFVVFKGMSEQFAVVSGQGLAQGVDQRIKWHTEGGKPGAYEDKISYVFLRYLDVAMGMSTLLDGKKSTDFVVDAILNGVTDREARIHRRGLRRSLSIEREGDSDGDKGTTPDATFKVSKSRPISARVVPKIGDPLSSLKPVGASPAAPLVLGQMPTPIKNKKK